MKNKLIDIHNSLMLSLEMLDDDDLFQDAEKSKMILERAKTKAAIAKTIVDIDRLGFEAAKFSIEERAVISPTLALSDKTK